MVVWIDCLAAKDGINFLPDPDEPMWGRREVVPDHPVEPVQMIARHGGEHVVLDMVVHLPIKKAEHRVERERAAAEAKIIHVVL